MVLLCPAALMSKLFAHAITDVHDTDSDPGNGPLAAAGTKMTVEQMNSVLEILILWGVHDVWNRM